MNETNERRIREMQDSSDYIVAIVPNSYATPDGNCRNVWEVVDLTARGLYEADGRGILAVGNTIDEAIEAAYSEWRGPFPDLTEET